MKQQTKLSRAVQMGALAALIGLAGFGPAMAAAQEEPLPQGSASVQSEPPAGRGCQCGQGGASANGGGGSCPGRKMGQGQREGEGQGQGQGMRQGVQGHQGPGRAQGMRHGGGKGAGMSGGCRRGGDQNVMQAMRALVHDYRQDIVREIEDIPNGVATTTRAPKNPAAVEALQRHVDEMKGLLEDGGRIRGWDPLFSEIFDHAEEIEVAIEVLDDGVRVVETSPNPEVVKLIRAHARKVSDFVARGPAAVHEPTPLPEDYGAGE